MYTLKIHSLALGDPDEPVLVYRHPLFTRCFDRLRNYMLSDADTSKGYTGTISHDSDGSVFMFDFYPADDVETF